MGLLDASDSRLAALTQWVIETLGFADGRIEPASADASFRRYFRVTRGADSCIVMDAPPEKEDVTPFVNVARTLAGMGLNVPIVLAASRPNMLKLAGRATDGVLISAATSPPFVKACLAQASSGAAGRPFRKLGIVYTKLGATEKECIDPSSA